MVDGNLKVTVTLQNPLDKEDTIDYVINVNDTELGALWFSALQDIVRNNNYLEKNFCFLGFPDNPRNLDYICKELKWATDQINSFFEPEDYRITEKFTPETMRGNRLRPNQEVMNNLHNHFEHLQGTVWGLSDYYKRADYDTKFAIRQLNNLCHEAESLMLSQSKQVNAPEWIRPSQITTFFNATRYEFPEQLKTTFNEAAYDRVLGGVYLHWTQIGKTLFEVFRDEEGVDVDQATCDAITHLRYYSGEFDIEWGKDVVYGGEQPWHTEIMSEFREWLVRNGFDTGDNQYNFGYHPVGQVDLQASFGTSEFSEILSILSKYLDIFAISCDDGSGSVLRSVYPYTWSDPDHYQQQIARLTPGYDYSSRMR